MIDRRYFTYGLIAPSAAVFGGLFVAPFLYFFVVSFWTVKLYKVTPAFTFDNYLKALTDHADTGLFTIVVSLVSALLTTILGFLFGFIIRFKAGRWHAFLLFVSLITMFGGYLMKIYAWKTILGNEGLLNTGLMSLGLIGEPIDALLYSPAAVVLTMIHFNLPFAVLPIYGSMRGIKDIELEAARDLGARPLAVFADIVIPRCRLGLITSFTFCFLITAGDYITPLLVGGKITMIGNLIAPQFGTYFNWPLGAAMSFLVLALALAVVLLCNLAFPKRGFR
jgi:spermidine/putrescine transport system permease protein